MDSIVFPIKFNADKSLAKHASDSSEQYGQFLSFAAQTVPGELPLTPSFGCQDPTFSESAKRQLVFTAVSFFPEVELVDVQIIDGEEGQSMIDISFDTRT
jgi:hypothetical protein